MSETDRPGDEPKYAGSKDHAEDSVARVRYSSLERGELVRYLSRGDVIELPADRVEVEALGGEHHETVEFGDRLAGAVATMRGEAGEIAARRPHPDAHLYDIEEGLRFRADGLESWLEEEYYR